MTNAEEIRRVYAEGQAAEVGADNPYNGQAVLAAMWRSGYRQMLDAKVANSPARRAYLEAHPEEQ